MKYKYSSKEKEGAKFPARKKQFTYYVSMIGEN
jgi:hypothetical protein